MKNLIFIFIALIGLQSCITRRMCDERFPPQVHDSIIVKDSLIYITDTVVIPAQTVTLHDLIAAPNVVYHKTIKQNGSSITVDINKGKLTAICHEDSLIQVANHWKRIAVKSHFRTEVHEKVVMKTAWYYTAAVWYSFVSLVALVLGIVWNKLVKKIPF